MAQGNVEVWLGKLCTLACRSVRSVIRNASVALQDPNFNLMEFLESYPAQVSLWLCQQLVKCVARLVCWGYK